MHKFFLGELEKLFLEIFLKKNFYNENFLFLPRIDFRWTINFYKYPVKIRDSIHSWKFSRKVHLDLYYQINPDNLVLKSVVVFTSAKQVDYKQIKILFYASSLFSPWKIYGNSFKAIYVSVLGCCCLRFYFIFQFLTFIFCYFAASRISGRQEIFLDLLFRV